MINPNIPQIGSTLTIVKPLGKPLSLNIGEIIEAKVLDVFSTGGIALKIKGSVLTAQAEIALLKDSTVLFKVMGTDKQGGELRLQFMGYPENAAQPKTVETAKGTVLNKLIDHLSGMLSKSAPSGDVSEVLEQIIKALPPDSRTVPRELLVRLQDLLRTGVSEKSTAEIAGQFIRALPSEPDMVPKELLVRLQDLLKTGMNKAGEEVHMKLDKLMELLPKILSPEDPLVRNLKSLREEVMVRIDNILHTSLKNALADTGVSLEAKLKAMVEMLQRTDQPLSQADMSRIRTDLKAELLQLREQFLLTNKGSEAELVSSLLKDIETFQLLSKATDSFSTFLPVVWDELRKGEISFRKNSRDTSVRSFSCRLNLDLEGFGELSILVMMVDKEFSVYMKTDKSGFRDVLNASLHELRERFTGSGLVLKTASVLDRELSDAELERLESFERIVNIRI